MPRVTENPQDYQDHYPSWGVGRMDMEGEWSCARFDPAHFLDLLDKLKEYERLKWREIDTRYDLKRLHHYIDLAHPKLSKGVAERVAAMQVDADRVFSFHITATRRLWGVRDGPCFRVLWWDPDHTVYPVPKE